MGTEYVETSATGGVAAVPDLAVVRVGLECDGTTVTEALDGCAGAGQAAIAALDAHRIAPADRQTQRARLDQRWNQQRETFDGFTAVQSLMVRVRDTATVGDLVAALSEATGAAFRLQDVGWAYSDTTALEDRARRLAFETAHAKARQLADLGGRTLGPLIRVAEENFGGGGMVVRATMAKADFAVGSLPAEPGESQVEVGVRARWHLVG